MLIMMMISFSIIVVGGE